MYFPFVVLFKISGIWHLNEYHENILNSSISAFSIFRLSATSVLIAPRASFHSFLCHKVCFPVSHISPYPICSISFASVSRFPKTSVLGACPPAFSALLAHKKDARPSALFALFSTEFLRWWRINVSPLCKDDSYGGSATSPDGETEIGILGYRGRNLRYHSI